MSNPWAMSDEELIARIAETIAAGPVLQDPVQAAKSVIALVRIADNARLGRHSTQGVQVPQSAHHEERAAYWREVDRRLLLAKRDEARRATGKTKRQRQAEARAARRAQQKYQMAESLRQVWEARLGAPPRLRTHAVASELGQLGVSRWSELTPAVLQRLAQVPGVGRKTLEHVRMLVMMRDATR